jgi:hypothetical protein
VRSEVAVGALVARRIDNWDGATRVIHMLVRAEGRVPTRLRLFESLLRQYYAGSSSAAQGSFKSTTSAGAQSPAILEEFSVGPGHQATLIADARRS